MRIVQIIPGSGNTFYCENCLRDEGLVRALRQLGHDAMVVPLYLPLMTDDPDALGGEEVFFGGINVYLQQKFGLFRRTPRWVDRLFDSPRLLKWAARKAGMTDAEMLAKTALSMLRGKHGRQAKELDRLVDWLATSAPPDVVCISNVLLIGLVRQIKRRLNVPVVCLLQDEDAFLDAFPDPWRRQAWEETARRAAEVDAFLAVSRYYADVMRSRLDVDEQRMHVACGGIDLTGYRPAQTPPDTPAVGYLSRLCPEKGLDTLAEAFVLLKSRGEFAKLKLRVGGGWTAEDAPFVDRVRARLQQAGVSSDVELLANLDGKARREFLRSLSVLSVPTRRGEAFGMYILESLALGVPVAQPRHGSFIEIIEATGGGVLVPPNDPQALADAIGQMLLDPERTRAMGLRGRQAVGEQFTVQRMAQRAIEVCRQVVPGSKSSQP